MNSLNDAAQNLWSALDELSTWFTCLGGVARYPGFRNEDMPIAILVLLQARYQLAAPADELTHFLDPQFWSACEPIIKNVQNKIDKIQVESDEEIRSVICEFTCFVNTKMSKREMHYWPEVIALLAPTV
jgi:hypothetical protein